MDKSLKVEIPSELLPYLSENPEKKIKLLPVIELYREKKITLRQGADILKVSYRNMESILEENEIFLDFKKSDLDEEFQYGFSRK